MYEQNLKKRRKCGQRSETQAHILNRRTSNKNAISKRHNLVADKIAELLGGGEWKKTREKSHKICECQESGRLKVIGLIILGIIIDGEPLKMIEITCPYDSDLELLREGAKFIETGAGHQIISGLKKVSAP